MIVKRRGGLPGVRMENRMVIKSRNLKLEDEFVYITLHILKLALIVLVLTVAGGCTNQAMNSVIASWQNQPVSDAIAEWGQPSEELKVAGKHLYVWNTYDGILSPPLLQRPSKLPDTRYCMRLLEVDRTDKIIFGAWEGKNCPGLFSGWGR